MRHFLLVGLFASAALLQAQPVINPVTLPRGLVGSTFGMIPEAGTSGRLTFSGVPDLVGSGGTPPYQFSISAGVLPPGIAIVSGNGNLVGIPSATGTYGFTVRITDSAGATGQLGLSITVDPRYPGTLPTGRVGSSYLATTGCTSGSGATFTYSVSGTLPPGISLEATGNLRGAPTTIGTYIFDWTCSASVFTISVNFTLPILGIFTGTFPNGTVGAPYDFTPNFTGGTAPFVNAIVGGALPPGLSMAPATARITGTPTQAGSYRMLIRRTDATQGFGTGEYTIAINPGAGFSLSESGVELTSTKDGEPGEYRFTVRGFPSGQAFVATAQTESGGAWLKVSPGGGAIPAPLDITADPAGLEPGVYRGSVRIAPPSGPIAEARFAVTFNVAEPLPPQLTLDTPEVTVSVAEGEGAETQTVRLLNRGSGSVTFTTSSSAPWLTVAPGEGTVTPSSPAGIILTSDPANLAPGTYRGSVGVSVDGISVAQLPVTFAISPGARLRLSNTGVTFTAQSGATAGVAPFDVLSSPVPFEFQVTSQILSTGPNWLSATPLSGPSGSTFNVRANPAGLTPGDYYGSVFVAAPGVPNAPQTLPVVLRVLESDYPPAPDAYAVILRSSVGGPAPPDAVLNLIPRGARDVPFTASSFFATRTFFSLTPETGTVSPNQPFRVTIRPNTQGLGVGVYRGEITFRFGSLGSTTVLVYLLIPPEGVVVRGKLNAAEGCTPAALYPFFSALGPDFRVSAGWPTPLEVRLFNDCADPVTSGSVVVTFSNGDPPLPLSHRGGGRWSGTWTPRGAVVSTVLTARAQSGGLTATEKLGGAVARDTKAPEVASGGMLNGVSFDRPPLAPGSWIAIRGTDLAEGDAVAESAPLPTELAKAQAIIAGRAIPLRKTASGEIGALLPYDLPANTVHQLVIQRGTALSAAEPVAVAPAQPAIFTVNPDGKGQGKINWLGEEDSQALADPENPAPPGATLVIVCTGLGAVDPAVPGGDAPPADPLARTVNPVTVVIGGVEAEAQSAALVPGSPGVYEVRVAIPEGVAPAGDVTVVLRVAGQSSTPVTIAVKAPVE